MLACGGIYGSMLYTVGQRRREMGIRSTLDAAGADVVCLMMRHGTALVVADVAIGAAVSLHASGHGKDRPVRTLKAE